LKPELDMYYPRSTWRLNGLWSPFGFETQRLRQLAPHVPRLNGLLSPFGFETGHKHYSGTCRRRGGGKPHQEAQKSKLLQVSLKSGRRLLQHSNRQALGLSQMQI